jgi:hypothetical protein
MHYLPRGDESSPRGRWDICAPVLPEVLTYYDLGTFCPGAHHMDCPVNMCPYCNALLFHGEKSSLCYDNGCVHLPPLLNILKQKSIYFQNGTDRTFICDNFRAINQSYAMVSVKKEVERGAIHGSSFRLHISIMGRAHYRVITTQPPYCQRGNMQVFVRVLCT